MSDEWRSVMADDASRTKARWHAVTPSVAGSDPGTPPHISSILPIDSLSALTS